MNKELNFATCKWCGSSFVPKPGWVYKTPEGLVCRYNCQLAWERNHKLEVEERKQKRMKKRPKRYNNPEAIKSRKVPVQQYTLDGVFVARYDSVKQASDVSGFSCGTISLVAQGLRNRAGQYIFKYENEVIVNEKMV